MFANGTTDELKKQNTVAPIFIPAPLLPCKNVCVRERCDQTARAPTSVSLSKKKKRFIFWQAWEICTITYDPDQKHLRS